MHAIYSPGTFLGPQSLATAKRSGAKPPDVHRFHSAVRICSVLPSGQYRVRSLTLVRISDYQASKCPIPDYLICHVILVPCTGICHCNRAPKTYSIIITERLTDPLSFSTCISLKIGLSRSTIHAEPAPRRSSSVPNYADHSSLAVGYSGTNKKRDHENKFSCPTANFAHPVLIQDDSPP
jgi:hypothetical protein